jgi:hypothetical protein
MGFSAPKHLCPTQHYNSRCALSGHGPVNLLRSVKLPNGIRRTKTQSLAVCMRNTGYSASLEVRKLYPVVDDPTQNPTTFFLYLTNRARTTRIRPAWSKGRVVPLARSPKNCYPNWTGFSPPPAAIMSSPGRMPICFFESKDEVRSSLTAAFPRRNILLKEIRSLAGLRAFAALSVVLCHVVSPLYPGRQAVTLFFVLSGFLITLRLLDELRTCRTIHILRF